MTNRPGQDWYDPDATTFGDRLAGAREAAGMTQAELARSLGVRLKTLQAWEDDLGEPRANRLAMLAGLLNVSLSWLLTGVGDGPGAPGEGAEAAPDLETALAEVEALRVELARSAERLRRLEASLRAGLRSEALV